VLTRASGNRKLQSLIDLVVSRSMRIAAVSNDAGVWNLWLDGYADLLAHLERGDIDAAVPRYAQIFVEYRLRAQQLLFESP
jgi:DNA-binding GntR family transcriptional regulator